MQNENNKQLQSVISSSGVETQIENVVQKKRFADSSSVIKTDSADSNDTRIDKAEARLKNLEISFEKSQIKFTEILGIFVALFTFVSINIQVFSQVTSLRNALIFVILIFLCLTGFLYIMDIVLSQIDINHKNIKFGLIVMICLGMIAILLVQDFIPLSTEKTKDIKEINDRLIKIETKQEFIRQDRVAK